MSHVVEIQMEVRDLEALAVAATALGCVLNLNQKRFDKWGAQGDCLHAIAVVGNEKAYEIGVVANSDGEPGYNLHWDQFNGGYGLVDKVGVDACLLMQEYTVEVSRKELLAQGCSVEVERTEDGRAILRAIQP